MSAGKEWGVQEELVQENREIQAARLAEDGAARQRALVNMCFQMGTQGLTKFRKMIDAIMRDDWATARVEALNSKWARSDSPTRAQRVAHMLERGV